MRALTFMFTGSVVALLLGIMACACSIPPSGLATAASTFSPNMDRPG